MARLMQRSMRKADCPLILVVMGSLERADNCPELLDLSDSKPEGRNVFSESEDDSCFEESSEDEDVQPSAKEAKTLEKSAGQNSREFLKGRVQRPCPCFKL